MMILNDRSLHAPFSLFILALSEERSMEKVMGRV